MNFSILALGTLLFAIPTFATPDRIVCEKEHLFRGITRVEFKKVGTVDYVMTVFKEKSCQNTGCSYLKTIFQKSVMLFESPAERELLVTPDMDQSGDNISISFASGKCRVHIPYANFRFRGSTMH